MTLEDDYKRSLIQYRIDEAKETIDDVRLLIENDRLRAAVNRIYYGMFYSLLALGLAHEFETSKHPQLIGWFNKNFIHSKMINKAYNRRTKGDYDAYVDFDKGIVIEMFNDMKEFIS